MMVVEGSLQSREWNDKDGNRRKSIEVNVSQFHFCDKKESAPQYPQQNNEFQEIEDEEPGNLPF